MKQVNKLAVIFATAALLAGMFAAPASADTVKIKSEADTYVRSSSSYVKYNEKHYLSLQGSGTHNFVRFRSNDVAAADIGQAKLYLYANSGTSTLSDTTNFTLVGTTGANKAAWDETTLNYTMADETYDIIKTGEVLIKNRRISGLKTKQWMSFDVTDYVKKQTDGVYVFRFFESGKTQARFASHEVEGFEPYLELVTGDEGKILNALGKIQFPLKVVGNCSFTLPQTTEDGVTLSYSSESTGVSIDGTTVTISGLNAGDTIALTATGMIGTVTKTKEISAQLAADPFFFHQSGQVGTLDEITQITDKQVIFRCGVDLALPDQSKVYIATYDMDKRLINLAVYAKGQYQNGAVWKDWGQLDNVSRIAAFAWTDDLQPLYTRSIAKNGTE